MADSSKISRKEMAPDGRAPKEKRTKALLPQMPLQELRRFRALSQVQVAKLLNTKQANISKMERRADLYVSTLREVVRAMGGKLQIIARFPDGDVQINQYDD